MPARQQHLPFTGSQRIIALAQLEDSGVEGWDGGGDLLREGGGSGGAELRRERQPHRRRVVGEVAGHEPDFPGVERTKAKWRSGS